MNHHIPSAIDTNRRVIAVAAVAGFVVVAVGWLIAPIATTYAEDSAAFFGMVALLLIVTIATIAASAIAGSDSAGRRRDAVGMFLAMTAGVMLGIILADPTGFDPEAVDLPKQLLDLLLVAGIPVLMGSLLGYAIGREWRRARG